MCILNLEEIQPGIVVWCDSPTLSEYEVVGPNPDDGKHMFLCLSVYGDRSTWVMLTSKNRDDRLKLHAEWKLGYGKSWHGRDTYISGSDRVCKGFNYAFQEASKDDEYSMSGNRNKVTQEGLDAIREHLNIRA